MELPRLAVHLGARALALGLALTATVAFAQQTPPASDAAPVPPGTTAADVAASPGLPGPLSVDPAPGTNGAYAGHSEHAFYDVNDRIRHVQDKIGASLSGNQQRRAMNDLNAIKSEEKDQIARHGSLLDWARENLNHRLDALLQTYPALAS